MMKQQVQISGNDFRRMQLLELEMLVEFHKLCIKHNINYVLFGGSMLGAVRHKGFIPWDDDADIAMLREDYEKFKRYAHELNSEICFFQDHTTDEEYRWGYGKLRKTGTSFVRVGQEHLKCKTGVFVDVFPMDEIPNNVIGQMINDFYCFCLRKILYSEVGRVAEENFLKRKIYGILAKIDPKIVFDYQKRLISENTKLDKKIVRCLLFPATGKLYRKNPIKQRYGMPKAWFEKRCLYDFEGFKLFGSEDYDAVLKYIYGDYMKLPAESEREPHSPVSSYEF